MTDDEVSQAERGFLQEVLDVMVRDKELPKYRFEPLAAIFLAPFLPQILEEQLGGKVRHIVPEFPLKKSPPSNQSTNVDFLLLREAGEESYWILFELKTDAGSFRCYQMATYSIAREQGMRALRSGLEEIHAVTRYRAKYATLIRRMDEVPEFAWCDQVEIVLLGPSLVDHAKCKLEPPLLFLTFDDLPKELAGSHSELWPLVRDAVVGRAGEEVRSYAMKGPAPE